MNPAIMDQISPHDNEGWFKRHVLTKLESIEDTMKDNKNASEIRHRDFLRKADNQTVQLQKLTNEVHSFRPVKKIVYGVVALVLTGLLGALLALVIKSQ